MKKLKYPEYIDGVKQEQNPVMRTLIKLWYSDWFRLLFIICPVWLLVVFIAVGFAAPEYMEIARAFASITYIVLLVFAMHKNDYSELRRIGLDEWHQPL